MSERRITAIKELFKGVESGDHYSKFGKTVEITHGDIKFVGFLVEKSFVIPTNAGKGSDELISLYVGANLEVVRSNSKEEALAATCHLLGLTLYGQKLGLFSDGQSFGQITGVHFHHDDYVESQDDFIKLASEALSSVGAKLTILD